ncbi:MULTISPECIES: TerD family protein [Mycolicibacterium]|uniref:TerD family protein n=1 Tax=Mycolicibacterium TaxID=1866885 RepID=UPI001CDC8AD2|nr:TerD family protein [Mycolicibacterium fortuitum]UBV20362.1 TerD family protein [Mycolicibacterium fortuitum]
MAVDTLVAGQNCALSQRTVRFDVDGQHGGVAALLLDERGHATTPDKFVSTVRVVRPAGVTLAHTGAVDIRIDALDREVARVLCIATDPPPHAELTCRLTGEADSIVFPIKGQIHPAMVCFELYRRDGRWKVRAVGQGYGGGLPELLAAHHLDLPTTAQRAAPFVAATPAPSVAPAFPASAMHAPIQPLGDSNPLERLAMIHEDAARITAALLTARSFAEDRRDTEMSEAVADPATRNTTASQDALASAQRRHDDLLARAQGDYQRDAAHLIAELAALDSELPAALAPWDAPSWSQAVRTPSNGIRVGTVTVPDVGALTVPFCVSAPLRRPIWLDSTETSAAAPVAASVVLRLLASVTHAAPTLDIIDVSGGLQPLWQPLAAHMPRPVVTEPPQIVARLQHLIDQADLATLRRRAGEATPAGGVLVIADFGYAMPAQAYADVVRLINMAEGANMSLVFTGDPQWDTLSPTPILREIAEHCLHLPVDAFGASLCDPWTHNVWQFAPCALQIDHRVGQISAALAQTFR